MRTLVFIDGQNLYRLAMRAYGRVYPYYYPRSESKVLPESQVRWLN